MVQTLPFSDLDSGPKYGDITIVHGPMGFFTAKDERTREDNGVDLIKINHRHEPYLSLTDIGLTLKDIEHIETNDFGFKIIAQTDYLTDMELAVTKTGKVFLYDEGVPSIIGFPSRHEFISCPYIKKDGVTPMPRYSCFNHAMMYLITEMYLGETFHEPNPNALSTLHLVDFTEKRHPKVPIAQVLNVRKTSLPQYPDIREDCDVTEKALLFAPKKFKKQSVVSADPLK